MDGIETLEGEWGRSWLGDALITYYTDVRPVPDREAQILAVLKVGTDSLLSIKPSMWNTFQCIRQVVRNEILTRDRAIAA